MISGIYCFVTGVYCHSPWLLPLDRMMRNARYVPAPKPSGEAMKDSFVVKIINNDMSLISGTLSQESNGVSCNMHRVDAVSKSPSFFRNLPQFLLHFQFKSRKMKSSLHSLYYAEVCNQWRNPSPQLSARATQL